MQNPASFHTHSPVKAALVHVKQHCKGVDASHDISHIERVLALTDRIARAEGLNSCELEMAWLCAVLHDVGDPKYTSNGVKILNGVLDQLQADGHITPGQAQRIQAVVLRVSFREELPGGMFTPGDLLTYPELGPVKDADQLDAIGAIGIARTFAFGGALGREMYSSEMAASHGAGLENRRRPLPASKIEYLASSAVSVENGQTTTKCHDTLTHFHDKLLHLAARMKTSEGRALAKARHAFMESFVAEFVEEITGKR